MKIMKKMILLAVIAMMSMSVSAQQNEQYNSFIQVNGRAEKEIAPDQFYLSIVINEIDSKGKISVENQQRDMIAALKRIGIDVEKNLKMANMSSSHFKKSTSLSTAKYQLELDSPAKVAKVYSVLGDMGISNISISKVSNSKIDELKEQVRIEAIRNAKATATTLAEAIGQSIGKCFYIYDSNSDVIPAFYDNAVVMRSMAKATGAVEEAVADEPLDFKTIKISCGVNAKFVLE